MCQFHQLEMSTFETTKRMPHVEVVPQRLYDDVFGRQYLFGGTLGSAACCKILCVQEKALGFVGDEHSSARDDLSFIRHRRIEKVEAAQKLDACCLLKSVLIFHVGCS